MNDNKCLCGKTFEDHCECVDVDEVKFKTGELLELK